MFLSHKSGFSSLWVIRFFILFFSRCAIDAALFESACEAVIARNAPGGSPVALQPAIGKARLPDERPGEGDVFHTIIPDGFLDDFV